jgi:hypothetical protein
LTQLLLGIEIPCRLAPTVTATTAAATTTTTASATAVTTTAATTTLFPRTGFVHGQRTSFVLLFVQSANGFLRRIFIGHFHEAETFASARVAILHNLCTYDGTELSEQLFQALIGYAVTQIANIKSLTHRTLLED